MWIELGVIRPGVVLPQSTRTWVNTDHIVRVEFLTEGNKLTATVTSTKPGGSDRTIFQGDDAERLRLAMNLERGPWQPYLDFELKAFEEAAALKAEQETLNKPTKKPAKKGKK